MATLLAAVSFGVLFAIFAAQNASPITLNFGKFIIYDVPAYLVILIPLLVGLLLSMFFYLAKDLSQSLTIGHLKDQIKDLKKEIAETNKSSHKLEIENTKLKTEKGEPPDEDSF